MQNLSIFSSKVFFLIVLTLNKINKSIYSFVNSFPIIIDFEIVIRKLLSLANQINA